MSGREKQKHILNQIHEKFPNFRSDARWRCPVFAYESVEDFSRNADVVNGIHTIYDGTLPLDLHLTVDQGKPLVVFLNAKALLRDENYRLPSFVGFGVVPATGVSVLRINDPLLYTSRTLKIGWYADAKGISLLMPILEVISKVVDMTIPSKIIFIGGSAAGFASLKFSRFFRNSLAVVWNPQTDLLKFAKDEVLEFTSSAFGIDDFETCERILPALTVSSVHKYYAKNQMLNYVLYMQNIDDWHTRWHCKPFLKSTGRNVDGEITTKAFDERFFLYAADWGKGHAPPPTEFLKSLLRSLTSDSISFDSLFIGDTMKNILLSAELAN